MRSFFKSELETLKIKTGLNQYENISALTDAEHQFKLLFDSLEDVCAQYPYIPDNDKKRIVQEQIYRDQDFNQLTPRVLWKWLEREKGKYFREAAHVDGVCPVCNQQVNHECNNTFHQRANAKSVSYEELSPATKAAWDAYMKSLQSDDAGFKRVPEVTQKEIDDIKIEDLEEREGKHGIKYPSTSKEYVELNQKKIEWAKIYTDLYTGKLKEGAPTFEEWLEGYKGGKD